MSRHLISIDDDDWTALGLKYGDTGRSERIRELIARDLRNEPAVELPTPIGTAPAAVFVAPAAG
jgi:hypothetical protein